MATVPVEVDANTWTVLPTADYFTVQNKSNYVVLLKASATTPTNADGAHEVMPKKTAGSLDDLAHYVWCAHDVELAFTADSR